MLMLPRLPNSSQRLLNIGRTGSGKTVCGCWHLSRQPVEQMPWVVFNFKSDELIDSIPFAEHVEMGYVPKRHGVYVVHPLPQEQEKLEDYLWKIWERRNCGIFCDEGYMMGNLNKAFEACLTQGRSLRIPIIANTQRPSWITRFAFSEADFVSLFDLTDEADMQRVYEFMPVRGKKELPPYHSYYFEVARKQLFSMSPVPDEQAIFENFDNKLRKRRRLL